MTLLILFNADWSATLTVTKNTNGWAKSSSIKSQDLPAEQQAVLASKIELFRGVQEPWVAKQVNASEVFLPVEVMPDVDGALIEDAEPLRAIKLTAYVVNPETGEMRWITAQDMPDFLLTDKASLDFWDYLQNNL